jgi:hypothetical protein
MTSPIILTKGGRAAPFPAAGPRITKALDAIAETLDPLPAMIADHAQLANFVTSTRKLKALDFYRAFSPDGFAGTRKRRSIGADCAW